MRVGNGDHLANVVFTAPACPFEHGANSPCSMCADYASEECQTYAAEYCAEHPEDSGCTLYVPYFPRTVLKDQKVLLHTDTLIMSDLYFVPESCGCVESCATPAVQPASATHRR